MFTKVTAQLPLFIYNVLEPYFLQYIHIAIKFKMMVTAAMKLKDTYSLEGKL